MTPDTIEELLSGLVRARGAGNTSAAVEGARARGGVVVSFSVAEARRVRFEHRHVVGLEVVAAVNLGRWAAGRPSVPVIIDASCAERLAEAVVMEARRRRIAEADRDRHADALARAVATLNESKAIGRRLGDALAAMWLRAWLRAWDDIGAAYARDVMS